MCCLVFVASVRSPSEGHLVFEDIFFSCREGFNLAVGPKEHLRHVCGSVVSVKLYLFHQSSER